MELEGTLKRAEISVSSALSGKDISQIPTPINSNQSGARNNTSIGQSLSHVSEGSMVSEIKSLNSRSITASNGTSLLSPSSTITEYTVEFEAGSIGLKVEPVLKHGSKEFGCRVHKFVEDVSSPSQAKKSGKIEVGHVLTAVNGRNVTAKTYNEIVSLLSDSKSEGKSITFRIPRTPMSSAKRHQTPTSTYTARSRSFEHQPKNTTIDMEKSLYDSTTPPTTFSPSFVKKMSRTTLKDHVVFPLSTHKPVKRVSDVLGNVMKNIAPLDPSDEDDSSFTSTRSTLSKRISEALAGSHSQKFDETVQRKMELLTELSEAKTSLGEKEIDIKNIENRVTTLAKEKENAESILTNLQEEKVSQNACYYCSLTYCRI